ncbi:hypothetical protein Z042_00830 [Chania multitudinisentens RB-25]|uniref:Uncharacterized protein n=1 Tax=Chania multitudinisentens RB-25 TaxID=1441930 RepID=W0LKP3_9GAMM|nr:hypothetical protein Z042_00830 [Chania multitudinisentens RB-25]
MSGSLSVSANFASVADNRPWCVAGSQPNGENLVQITEFKKRPADRLFCSIFARYIDYRP